MNKPETKNYQDLTATIIYMNGVIESDLGTACTLTMIDLKTRRMFGIVVFN